ncbi:MAG: lytic transglycosylase domain-containing protein [Acidobacteriota bacterium]|nr:lytic transglycosylase domain-containing protein [Acidobacteriota bacterium]
MRKFCLLLVLPLISAVSASAQINQQFIDYNNIETGIIAPDLLSDETENENFITPQIKTQQKNSASAPVLKMAVGKSLGAFSTGDTVIDGFIVDSCLKYDIDPLLIYAQMNQESKFKRRAISHKGARGLMQLIPATAVRFGAKDIYDPQQNIEVGVKYMRWLLNKFDGDIRLALAAYNAGENAVIKHGRQIPPYRETQNYVSKITARYAEIASLNMESWKWQQ